MMKRHLYVYIFRGNKKYIDRAEEIHIFRKTEIQYSSEIFLISILYGSFERGEILPTSQCKIRIKENYTVKIYYSHFIRL